MGLRKDSEKDYGNQEELGNFGTPDSGKYVVVIKDVRRVTTGGGSKKVRAGVLVLKGVSIDTGGDVDRFNGKIFGIDLWWNFDKKYNEQKLAFLIRACHQGEIPSEFVDLDTDRFIDTDENLVKALTGVPFGMHIEAEERSYKDRHGNDKKATDVRIIETKHMKEAALKKFTKDPDFKEQIGSPEDRLLEEKDYGDGSGGGGSGSGGSDDSSWADDPDDDLPF